MPPPSEATSSTEYAVGGRYLNARTHQPLTVRYIGPLPGTDTTWIGVEYDDPTKGKHSGEYKGASLFRTTQPGSGAFIKYSRGSSPLQRGVDLVDALQERYGALEGEGSAEGRKGADSVQLGNSGITVEAPGMADVARRIGRLEKLREIGFDGEWVAQLGGDEHLRAVFKERLKGVRTLDLSNNLVATWSDVVEIVAHLPGLNVLILNHSRIQSPNSSLSDAERSAVRDVLAHIAELHLGHSALTWPEAVDCASLFPSLEVLYLNNNTGINDFRLCEGLSAVAAMPSVKTLSLDGCGVDSWTALTQGLNGLPSLSTLQVSEVPISSISPRCEAVAFPQLSGLSLGDTHVSQWADIDHLDDWTAGRLEHLRISCAGNEDGVVMNTTNPRVMSGDPVKDRPFFIAKLAALTKLNGTTVTSAERWDAELYYIHFVEHLAPEQRDSWGRYRVLVEKHGTGPKPAAPKASTLKSKMINLNVIPPNGMTRTLRILPSATVASVQKRVARQLKEEHAKLWTARPHSEAPDALGVWEPLEEMDEAQEIGYWVGDGDTVVVVL